MGENAAKSSLCLRMLFTYIENKKVCVNPRLNLLIGSNEAAGFEMETIDVIVCLGSKPFSIVYHTHTIQYFTTL